MAAYAAAGGGRSVVVLEKNDVPAKKIYATGNGRCNFLNCEAAPDSYLSRGSDAESFVSRTFGQAGPDELLDVFETMGLMYSEEEDGRM